MLPSTLHHATILTSREAGQLCGVNFRTIILWVECGQLRASRLPGRGDYRIALTDLKEFANRSGLPIQDSSQPSVSKILIVDDDPPMAKSIQRVLRQAGYETQIAPDGLQAGSLIHSFQRALMTLDLRMPGLDGFGVLNFLKKTVVMPSLKILFISGESAERLRSACEIGAHDALEKSIDKERFLSAVRRLLPTPHKI